VAGKVKQTRRGGRHGFARNDANECDASGYEEQQATGWFHNPRPASYAEQGDVGYFRVTQEKVALYNELQHQQMAYLRQLASRASQGPTAQRTPKCLA
jgi:hypothetical protein